MPRMVAIASRARGLQCPPHEFAPARSTRLAKRLGWTIAAEKMVSVQEGP